MIKDLDELNKILDEKVKPLKEAIAKEDQTTEKYGQLIDNFKRTMGLSTNLTRTLMDVVARAEAMKEKEEDNNESNN